MPATQTYERNTIYYMVDYMDFTEGEWIRLPYQTLEQVSGIIRDLSISGKKVHRFRVMPEIWLDQQREAEWNEKKKDYELDAITYREFFFDTNFVEPSQRNKGEALVNA